MVNPQQHWWILHRRGYPTCLCQQCVLFAARNHKVGWSAFVTDSAGCRWIPLNPIEIEDKRKSFQNPILISHVLILTLNSKFGQFEFFHLVSVVRIKRDPHVAFQTSKNCIKLFHTSCFIMGRFGNIEVKTLFRNPWRLRSCECRFKGGAECREAKERCGGKISGITNAVTTALYNICASFLLSCLWKRCEVEVVLELQVAQAQWDLCFTPP